MKINVNSSDRKKKSNDKTAKMEEIVKELNGSRWRLRVSKYQSQLESDVLQLNN